MTNKDMSVKAEAIGLLIGIDPQWEQYLSELVALVDSQKVSLDWKNALYPLPKQLRNPSVIREFKDGAREYASSQLWLRLNKEGDRELLVPDETSGVLLEGETGKVLKPFNGLPLVTPDNTDFLIRIYIKETETTHGQFVSDMNWSLYTNSMC